MNTDRSGLEICAPPISVASYEQLGLEKSLEFDIELPGFVLVNNLFFGL